MQASPFPSTVFRMGGRERDEPTEAPKVKERAPLPRLEEIPIVDDPLPDRKCGPQSFWRDLADSIPEGKSALLKTKQHADKLAFACRAQKWTVATRLRPDGQYQVKVIHKPKPKEGTQP